MAKADRVPTTQGLPEEPPEPKGSAKTQYVIMRADRNGMTWEAVDDIEASSAIAAVRKHYASDQVEGSYVAVPKRSWQVIKVKVERTEKLIIAVTSDFPTTHEEAKPEAAEVPCANPECEHDVTLHMAAGSCQACDCTQYVGRQELAVDVPDIDPDGIPF